MWGRLASAPRGCVQVAWSGMLVGPGKRLLEGVPVRRPESLRLAVLGAPDYRRVLVADAATSIGTGASTVVLMVLLTGWQGPAGLSVFLLAQALPGLMVGTLAGVAADRGSRRGIVVVANVVRSGLALCLIPLAPDLNMLVFGLVAARSAAGSPASTANQALVPSTVCRDQLADAYSLLSGVRNIGRVAGMGVGGLLVAGHPWPVFVLDAGCFLIAALLRWRISTPAVPAHIKPGVDDPAAAASTWTADLAAGLRFVAGQAAVRNVLLVIVGTTLVTTAMNVLSTPFIVGTLDAPAWWIAVIEAVGVATLVVAAVVGGPTVRRLGTARALVLAVFAIAGSMVLMALTPRVEWLLPIEILSGVAAAISQAVLPTMISLGTPDELRGRALAALGTISQSAYLLAIPTAGFLAQLVGTRLTFAVASVPAVLIVLACFGRTALRGDRPSRRQDGET